MNEGNCLAMIYRGLGQFPQGDIYNRVKGMWPKFQSLAASLQIDKACKE